MSDFSAWDYILSPALTITGSTDEDKVNYPVPITIPYNSSYMRSDFGDIRFALADGTEFEYAIKNLVTSDHCDFLVKIPSLPASPATVTINIYAGNPSVTTTSDPSNVCLTYDDGSSDKSSNYALVDISDAGVDGTFVYDSTNKQYILTSQANDENFVKINSLTGHNNLHLECYIQRTTGVDDQEGGLIIQETASNNYVRARYITTAANRLDISPYTNGTDTTSTQQSYTISINTWYKISMDLLGTNLTIKWYNASGTLLYTQTATLTSGFTNGSFGFYGGKRANAVNVFKNVIAYEITANPPTVGSLGSWETNVVQLKSTITILQLSEDLKSTITVLQCADLKSQICIRQVTNDLKNTLTVTALTSNGLKSTLLIPSPFSIEQNTHLQSTITITAPLDGASLKSSIIILGVYNITMTLRATVLRTGAILDGLNEQSPSLVVNIGGDLYV